MGREDAMERDEILVVYGKDIGRMTASLLEESRLASMIGDRDKRILVKPNLVVPARPSGGATTHMEIIRALLGYLRDNGFRSIVVGEGSWVGSRTEDAFALNGYKALAGEFGAGLRDLKKGPFASLESHGIPIQMAREALDCGFLISLPVLKGHGQTLMTCALKNMKGTLSDQSKRRFHQLGLHRPIAALNSLRCADYVLVDSICGDLDFEEGGTPVQTDRMFCGVDSVLVDAFGASLMGFALDEIPYIGLAEEFGVGTADLSRARIRSLNQPVLGEGPRRPRRDIDFSKYVDQRSACSACYGNLVHALKNLMDSGVDPAFPERIRIGQGFRDSKEPGCLGIGACTGGLGGCPPSATEILAFLRSRLP